MKFKNLLVILSILLFVSSASAVTQYNLTVGSDMAIIFNGTAGTTTYTIPPGVTSVTYLVQAGGGGGGYEKGGGGGAGGQLNGTLSVVPSTVYNITVGSGGVGGTSGSRAGSRGGNSSFGNTTVSIITNWGGGGSTNSNSVAGTTGGCGGGASIGAAGYAGNTPPTTPTQGYSGTPNTGGIDVAGGGGGAGSPGENYVNNTYGANGGACTYSSITGISLPYGGGGGGGVYTIARFGGRGGCGIGGSGTNSSAKGGNGVANTGSGGGGGGIQGTNGDGGNGAAGVVILRFSTSTIPLDVNFTAVPNPSVVSNSVAFTDITTVSPTTWNWTFGDIGVGNTSTLQNPSHTYTSTGIYPVSLNVTNSSGGYAVKTNWQQVVNVSGFNQQDIVMEPQFTLTIHITDSSTGAAIPVNTVTTSGGQSYTTTNGTAYFSVPYSIVVVYVASEGYYGASTSYVMDIDKDETIQLTKSRDEYYQPVTSLPKEVQFHVQTLFGSPIPNANVSVYGYITTTGNWDWVVTLLGMELDKAPINQSTMYGDTDINGDITFLMIPSTKYSITTTASGYSFTPMNIAVNDRTYTIVSDFNSTGWWGSGNNEQLDVNITVSKKVVNKTYGTINVTYNDPNLVTVGGNIHIYRPNTTRGGANVLVATMPITGNSFQNWTGVPINAITGADYIVKVEAVTST